MLDLKNRFYRQFSHRLRFRQAEVSPGGLKLRVRLDAQGKLAFWTPLGLIARRLLLARGTHAEFKPQIPPVDQIASNHIKKWLFVLTWAELNQ